MSVANPNITVNVDVANPGQFFACCGLLELADRLWPRAEVVGAFSVPHFDRSSFCIFAGDAFDSTDIVKKLLECRGSKRPPGAHGAPVNAPACPAASVSTRDLRLLTEASGPECRATLP